jgi:hypothetical protein
MNAAFAWLNDLVRWFGQFFPRWVIIRVTEGGLKYKWKRTVELHPGVNFYWPVTTEIQVIPIVRRTLQIPTQVVPGPSGELFPNGISAFVAYSVVDVTKALRGNWKLVSTIEDTIQASLARKAFHLDLGECDIDALNESLTTDTRADLERFGVKVETMGIVHLCPTIPVKKFGDWAVTNRDQ